MRKTPSGDSRGASARDLGSPLAEQPNDDGGTCALVFSQGFVKYSGDHDPTASIKLGESPQEFAQLGAHGFVDQFARIVEYMTGARNQTSP